MKKAAFFAAWMVFAFTAATAQEKPTVITGNGIVNTIETKVPAYTGISANGPFDIRLVYAGNEPVTIEGETNLLDQVTLAVKEGKLIIATKDGQLIKPSANRKISVRVPYTKIENIALKGNGSVYAARTLEGKKLALGVDGSGSIRLKVDFTMIKVCVLGSGIITLKGQADSFNCKISGDGTIKAAGLEAGIVSASVSGCGTIRTNCIKNLKGRISGSGSIAFSGKPITDLRHSGAGKFSLSEQ